MNNFLMRTITEEEERALIEACARAMGYEVFYSPKLGWKRNVKIGSLTIDQVLWNPRTNSGDCAEMEDAKDVSVIHFKFCVEAISVYFSITEKYPETPTLADKSAARRLAVCRCVAASVKEK